MKTARLTLAIIGCAVFILGTSYASSPNPAPQAQSFASSTKPPGSEHSTDAASAKNGKRQKIETHSDGQRTRRHISDANHSRNRVSLRKANRQRQLRNGRARSTPENPVNVRQPSTSKLSGVARIADPRTPPARIPGITSRSGQQFRNAHNRASSMATIGGPVNPARNTAAINGTSINRRHVN
jgi:hypothetical protein